LQKTTEALNEVATRIFAERFGMDGIFLDNAHEVYNITNSGFPSLHKVKTFLA